MAIAHRSLDPLKLLVLAATLALGFYFWDAPALLPLKLLVVMMHETGHAVATWIVGGKVQRVVLASDQSGSCLSALPPSALRTIVVYSAGYLGSAVAGAGLLIAAFHDRFARAVPTVLSLWLAIMAVFYAGNAFTLSFCILTSLALFATRWLPLSLVGALDVALASFSALYAAVDLRDDLWNGAVRAHSDAQLLADLTYIPALVWALLWTGMALVILAVGARAAVLGGHRA